MPNYQIGDRVRCVRAHEWGNEGALGTITQELDEFGRVRVRWDEDIHSSPNYPWFIDLIYIEPVTPQDIQEIIRYAIVYQYPESNEPSTSFSATEAHATQLCRLVEAGNGMILAKKKIKLVVPVVTFPELTVDEDDNIVEEEDDGNAF